MSWDKIWKAIAAAVGAVAGVFGGCDTLLTVLLAFMAIDYVTGWLVAILGKSPKSETGHLDSSAGWAGLVKKVGELLAVIIAVLLDLLATNELGYHGAVFRTAMMVYIIATEGLSILENLGLIGVPFPSFIKNALEQLQKKADKGGDTHDTDGQTAQDQE